ncbi:MAG TPA: glycosyltransferase family 2 protein [Candidatus Polarisedimenticolaceae bacterium]|nr:glycosyltransferase family 2 protein [Candidatus Polarisedimenticolaceae bacterium]
MISVLVPTYKRPEKLARCLAAIAGQTYGDVEAVVVNDGGPSMRDVVAAMDGKLRVVLHEAKQNRGHFACRNVALDLAHGDLIAFCDDDDTYAPDHLASLAPAIAHADLAYSGVTIRATHEGGRVTMLPFSHPFDAALLRKTNFIVPSSVLYRRRLHERLGPFDEAAGPYWDWDWVLRVSAAGAIVHLPTIGVTYDFDLRGGNLSDGPEKDRPFLDYLSAKHRLGPLPSTNFYLMALNDAEAGDTMRG